MRTLSPEFDSTHEIDLPVGFAGAIKVQCKHDYKNRLFANKILGELEISLKTLVLERSITKRFTLYLTLDNEKIETGTVDLSLKYYSS